MALLSAWLCATMPVFAQEAYYWSYAQRPDLSYFDHPPMVAWLIWLGTHVLGDGAFGIRFGTWSCGLLTTWFGVLLLREFGADVRGQRVWVMLGVAIPGLLAARFLANPDPPLVAASTVTLYALWRARDGRLGWWLVAGLAAGCALLSKYTAGFLAISGALVLLLDPAMRRQLLRPGPWIGVFVAAMVFMPVVVWNVCNDFESFRFQTEARMAAGHFGVHWLLQCLGMQFGMVHPVVAVLFPLALWWGLRRASAGDRRMLWLLAFGVPLPAFLLVNSMWIQIKINWLTPAYVPLLLAMIAWWQESGFGRSATRASVVGRLVLVVPCLGVVLPGIRLLPQSSGTSWAGWEEFAAAAERCEDTHDLDDGRVGNMFFFAANYRDAAQLGRCLTLHWRAHQHPAPLVPGQPVMAQNVTGQRGLQFDHWESPRRHLGEDAVFVLPRADQREASIARVRRCFADVAKVERVEVSRLGMVVAKADVFLCHCYLGPDRVTERQGSAPDREHR